MPTYNAAIQILSPTSMCVNVLAQLFNLPLPLLTARLKGSGWNQAHSLLTAALIMTQYNCTKIKVNMLQDFGKTTNATVTPFLVVSELDAT